MQKFIWIYSSEEISTQHEQRIGGKEQAQEEDVANLSESESSEPLLVPQVKVAEDGSLIIDEERSEFTAFI